MERRNKQRDTTIFTVFSGSVGSKPADQMVFFAEPQKHCIDRIRWLAVEFAAALHRSVIAQQQNRLAEAAKQYDTMQKLKDTSRRKRATRRAMEAIEAGDANFVNQLSSRGGSITTMETVIEAMDDIDTFGGDVIAAVRGQACSAAGGMYLFGNERWMEKGSSVLIHGRSMNGDNERQLRGRAVHDIEQIYQPQFRKITNGNGQQAHIGSIIRAAEMDPTNHRIEFVLGEQDLLRTGVATDVFPDGRAMWDALHTRTRIGKVLGGSRKQSNHPLKQFYLEPPAVPGDRPSRQPVEQCNIAAQASEDL